MPSIRVTPVYEPHGPFVRAARRVWEDAEIIAVDVSPERLPELSAAGADEVLISDWMQVAALPSPRTRRLILGNPPFREAEEHIRHALDLMHGGDELAFLLRLNLLGSRSRLGLWASTPLAEVVPIVPRPSFMGGGSDATEYALFRWVKGHTGPTQLSRPLVWRASPVERTRGAGDEREKGGG